ncbi:F-box protein [Candidatus Bathyarchaeota archaeon]|nr:F-box protein [Candidatus Bathyarchaeota archaeon]
MILPPSTTPQPPSPMATEPPPADGPPTLENFPPEILENILYFLPPEDNLASFQLLSQHLREVANLPSLWRHHCGAAFKYWNPDHKFQQKLSEPGEVDWKRLFIERRRRNDRIALLFDGILSTRLGRLWRFEQICHAGYDAKDFLVEQCRVDEDAEDVLARR